MLILTGFAFHGADLIDIDPSILVEGLLLGTDHSMPPRDIGNLIKGKL
jgi:hypothetical protein